MSETYGLDFVPAERTRGGYEYKIMEIPAPRVGAYVACGIVFIPCEGWRTARWRRNGRRFIDTESGYDLVPMVKHRYARRHPGDYRVSNWFNSMEEACSMPTSTYDYYIIHEITYHNGKVELEALDPERLDTCCDDECK